MMTMMLMMVMVMVTLIMTVRVAPCQSWTDKCGREVTVSESNGYSDRRVTVTVLKSNGNSVKE
jgi:hypothetical protein